LTVVVVTAAVVAGGFAVVTVVVTAATFLGSVVAEVTAVVVVACVAVTAVELAVEDPLVVEAGSRVISSVVTGVSFAPAPAPATVVAPAAPLGVTVLPSTVGVVVEPMLAPLANVVEGADVFFFVELSLMAIPMAEPISAQTATPPATARKTPLRLRERSSSVRSPTGVSSITFHISIWAEAGSALAADRQG
jgi:hypothetical protein